MSLWNFDPNRFQTQIFSFFPIQITSPDFFFQLMARLFFESSSFRILKSSFTVSQDPILLDSHTSMPTLHFVLFPLLNHYLSAGLITFNWPSQLHFSPLILTRGWIHKEHSFTNCDIPNLKPQV